MSARQQRTKPQTHHRLDIQGLRMVAVVLVLLAHIFGWPRGGFIGVDVFLVISGFLITGILLRDAEKHGHVSFIDFYRRRIRRIIPAATITLAATALVSWLLFSPTRAAQTLWDTISAFFFVSNWRFATTGTDYFTADGPISPVRHFWSLSVEEQFYFVWPAVMAVIVLIAARRGMSLTARRTIAGGLMAALVTASFTWALIDTAHNPTWSYFSTLTRAWELGAGALIAIFATNMAAIPEKVRPVIAWAGLLIIGFGAFWISEDSGFPGPWAILPVIGSTLVIIAGTGGPTRYLAPLTNPVSTRIGDLSYSLYLWHWPVLIFLGTALDIGLAYYLAALGITVALSVWTFYLVEQPILASSWLKPWEDQSWRQPPPRSGGWQRRVGRNISSRFTFEYTRERQVAAAGGLVVLACAILPASLAPREAPLYIPSVALDAPAEAGAPPLPPAVVALQQQITDAVKADRWPELNPTMDAVLGGPKAPRNLAECGRISHADCWFGSPDAPRTVVLAGDSIGISYLAPMVAFVEASGGQWRLLNQATIGCPFLAVEVKSADAEIGSNCPARKQQVVNTINELRPDVVVISNHYGELTDASTGSQLTEGELKTATRQIVEKFAAAVGTVAFLTAPPADKAPIDCYRPDESPAECVGQPNRTFSERLSADTAAAKEVDGIVIDTRPLFCTPGGYCPMFVGVTPMKLDVGHISPQYADLMSPAFIELLRSISAFAKN